MDPEVARAARAEARHKTMTIRKGRFGDEVSPEDVVRGAEAISLVRRLTRTSYSLAGLAVDPPYCREEIPFRFVRRPRT